MKKVLEYSGLIYASLIFFGYSYFDFYYDFFNVDIYSYLTISEVLLPFLSNISSLIILVVVFFVFYIFPMISFNSIISTVSIDRFINKKKYGKLVFYVTGFILTVASAVYSLFQLKSSIKESPNYIESGLDFGYIIIPIIIVVISSLLYYSLKRFGILIKSNWYNYSVLLILAYIMIFFHAYADYSKKINKINVKTVCFSYCGEKLKTDQNLIFIGETNDYIFLNSLSNNSIHIFERDNINELVIMEDNNQ